MWFFLNIYIVINLLIIIPITVKLYYFTSNLEGGFLYYLASILESGLYLEDTLGDTGIYQHNPDLLFTRPADIAFGHVPQRPDDSQVAKIGPNLPTWGEYVNTFRYSFKRLYISYTDPVYHSSAKQLIDHLETKGGNFNKELAEMYLDNMQESLKKLRPVSNYGSIDATRHYRANMLHAVLKYIVHHRLERPNLTVFEMQGGVQFMENGGRPWWPR